VTDQKEGHAMNKRKVRFETRPSDEPHIPPTRVPKYSFGDVLRCADFVGRVDSIYADYWSALACGIVPAGWFEMQNRRPSTKDQVFYGLVALNGYGAILAGEMEVLR